MNSIIPINLRGLFCLQKEASVSLGNITLQNVTMESDKYIVVRETLRNSVQVVILDMDKPKEVVRRPVTATADSALMNPSMKILALKYGKTLQLLDLEQKAQIKKHTATEHIAFWKWINEENIGIVTEEFVYHWAVAGNNEPIKMFQRHSTLINQPIINYRSDHEGKFLFLVGIVAKAPWHKDHQVDGLVQLYNSESKESQLIEAHAACFAQFKMEANAQPSSLFCYSLGNKNGNGKLHIFELSPIGNNPYLQKTIDFHYPADAIGDFPVSIQPSSKSGILYLFTKLGYVHLFDIETGTAIYSMRISDKAILVTTEYTQNNGVLCIDGSGKVLSVCLEESMVIPFITHHLQNPNLAYKLALRCNLPVTEELIIFKNNHHSQVGATVDTWQQPDEKTQSMEQATASDVAASNPLFKSTPSKMIVFKEKSGLVGSASLTIKNCELRAIYFKVKSNSSHFYSVRPDNGIIEPQESVKLIIQPNDDCLANFDVMAIKTHKFLIMAAIVSDLKVQVEEFWKGKKQGTEGVYAKKLKAKVQKEIKKKSGQLSDNIWQSSESTSLKKEKRSKTENQLAEQNLPKQNQKMAPPILDNLPTTNLMSEKSLKRRSPITESLEMILESELEQNQILEKLPNPSMAGPEEKLKKALQSSDELSGQNFKMASSSFSQAGSFVTVPEFALEQTMPKPSMKMPEGELKKAPQSSAELFEQNLRTASSSISDSLEIVPENESQRNQERPSPASENVQEFEFVPRVPKTALPTSEVVPSLSLKKGAIYSSSSANRSYGLYSGEKIISLLEKMSMKKAAQFRRELNSFLDKYEANILSGKDETL